MLPSGSRARLLDTIGFISNLPHELVDSFRTTLEEVENADIVLHIIDASNPNYAHQRETVLKVLSDLGFGEKFSKGRMVEVWNKVDLLTEEQIARLPKETANSFYVSVLKGTGVKNFMERLEELSDTVLNKTPRKFKYSISDHYRRLEWMKANLNIPNNLNEVYDYEPTKEFPQGSVEYTIRLDDASYGKYLKFAN